MLKIAQGAEAAVYRDSAMVIKERLSKAYRLPQLDEFLRRFRTRREAKILERLEEFNFPAPRLQDFTDKRMSVVMDFVEGKMIRDVLEEKEEEDNDCQHLARQIGEGIGKLHQINIIHGDLTTSNMIQNNGIVNFIDFGLSSFSERIEDKAVDLFLLDRALESKHYKLYPGIFEKVLNGYREANPGAEQVLTRFEKVKRRGRNKKK